MDVPRIIPRPRYRRVVLVMIAVGIVAAISLGLRWFVGQPPTIARGELFVGTVQRGSLTMEVRGQGTLVPVEIRWASSPVAARVDKVIVQPGTRVTPDTVVLELSNPDVELAALDAEREVGAAEAEYARLGATLDGSRLAQESSIASLEADVSMAKRRSEVDSSMGDQGVIPQIETAESADRARQLGGRLEFEKKRLGALRRGNSAQLGAQKAQVERLRALATFRRRQLEDLKVKAGTAGVVQEVAVEVGQTVASGAPLAKIVVPEKLQARLRVPESSAEDLVIGLPAVVDTRSGTIEGKITRVDPAARGGSVTVDVALPDELPKSARPDLTVDGTIQLARTGDVLYVQRPAVGEARSVGTLFKLTGDGLAERVKVQYGRGSVKEIEIVSGLAAGDRVVLSDMSRWDGHDRLRVE